VLGVGCWVLGVGCWVLGVGCWVLGVGCWVRKFDLGGGVCAPTAARLAAATFSSLLFLAITCSSYLRFGFSQSKVM